MLLTSCGVMVLYIRVSTLSMSVLLKCLQEVCVSFVIKYLQTGKMEKKRLMACCHMGVPQGSVFCLHTLEKCYQLLG